MTNIDDARALWALPLYNQGRDVKKAGRCFSVFFLWSYAIEEFLSLKSVLWSSSVVKSWNWLNQRCLANLLYYEIVYMCDVGWLSVTSEKVIAYRKDAMVTNEFYCNVIRRIRWKASIRAARSKSSTLHTKRTARWLEGKDEVFYQGNRRKHFLDLW